MDYTAFKAYTENGYVSRNPGPRFLLTLLIISLGTAVPARAADDAVDGGAKATSDAAAKPATLKPDQPGRYTVVKGDTLWGIAGRFLKNPWEWPRIWKLNEKIKNPHLIYPGDVIVLRYVDGKPELTVLRNEKLAPGAPAAVPDTETPRPTVKLSPRARAESLEKAVPTIPPNVIAPFLTQPLVVNETELEKAGYVTTGLDNRIALGNHSEFYARGLKDAAQEFYQIFRKGKPIRNPDNSEDILGYEAVYLGDAKRIEAGDPTKLVVTRVRQEIIPGDRLLATTQKPALPYYYPRPPKTRVAGKILSALSDVATAEMGLYTIVAINLGTREGIEEGNVLRVMRHAGSEKDPVTRESYKLPDEESALIMVFRTFEKVSYALVMNASRPVHVQDTVVTP
ncbi:MAG: LysM peptidoglycan-binding domain-containing protein [Pseudomonadota bacterium]